ncbi:putative imidazolonepropionase [Oratosquilla oratoria]|uniref:putative imidazolonepropionase n=1 Tax=Oratosquilla oratoria TaxID=337810 RepID=UPI003F776C1C
MASLSEGRLLLRGASQVVRVASNGERVKLKGAMSDLAILQAEEGQGLSVAVDSQGRIAAVGTDAEVASLYEETTWENVLDVTGMSVVPGLVDAHTHPVWAGDRVHEFAMKLAGASYMEVHAAGGGIHFTVNATKNASQEDLLELFEQRLQRMARAGTTLVECKSGYGLDTETELKMLRVMELARSHSPVSISSTFCGAHAVPKGMTSENATRKVIEEMLPAVVHAVQQGQLKVDSADVFCEKGVFDVAQSRRIMQACKDAGFLLNFHADELTALGGAEMGASLGAEAMSHLEEVSPAGVSAMAESGSVAVILPTTAYILRLPAPPVRAMIDQGVPVALGTDFNPNAFCLSMPLVMHLACVLFRMNLREALTAATLHAAHSLRRAHDHGSIEVGKLGNLVVVDSPRWEHLVYQLGGTDDTIAHVVNQGRVVYSKESM